MGACHGLLGMPPRSHGCTRRYARGSCKRYSSPDYKINTVLLFGAQGENSDLFPQHASIGEEWNKVYAYPKLTYSGISKALSEIADQLGAPYLSSKVTAGPIGRTESIRTLTMPSWLARPNKGRLPLKSFLLSALWFILTCSRSEQR